MRSDALTLPAFLNRNKEEWNFLIPGSKTVGGFWEQWVFILNDILHRVWNLSNQWFEKRKLSSGSNSSIFWFPSFTNHHLFTGFSWCLIVIYSLYSFCSIDVCAAWCPCLPDWAFVSEPIFSQFFELKFRPKRPKWHYVTVMGKKIDITRIQ